MRWALRGVALAILVAPACAPDLVRRPTSFGPIAPRARPMLELTRSVTVTANTGYDRTIAAGSTWRLAGSTPEGEVYRPVGAVFAVEGANMHEAYLVVAGDRLVGFYLPGEGAFSPLATPVVLPVK
jgi:hypothetical protein